MISQYRFFVFFYCQRIICMCLFYLRRYPCLRSHGVSLYNEAYYLYGIQQLQNGKEIDCKKMNIEI